MIWAKAALAGGLLVLLATFAMGTENQLSTSVMGARQDCGSAISASWLVSGTPDQTGPGSTATTDERRAAAACGPVVQQARIRVAALMGLGGLLALVGWGAVLTRSQPSPSAGRPWRREPTTRVAPVIPDDLLAHARAAKGFMPEDEGQALHRWATERLPHGPGLEVGTYCGKSAIWLGAAAREVGGTVFTVDHHRGSEENQAGWEHHDTSLVDAELGVMDTLPTFRRTIRDAGLEDQVVAVVGRSETVSRWWRTPLSLLFIDGGHGVEPARADFRGWPHHVMAGGVLLVHDVFPDPADGGRPPYEDIYLPALASGAFTEVETVGSMRVLRRTAGDAGDPLRVA